MKVGDYVRTKKGIAKIEGQNDDVRFTYPCAWITDTYLEINDDTEYVYDEDIIKLSPNIIDLIEVGDVIIFKDDEDVYKVIGKPDKKCALEVFYLAKKYDGNTEDIMVYPDEMKKYIKSIVTKEQFESMEYKVGGK